MRTAWGSACSYALYSCRVALVCALPPGRPVWWLLVCCGRDIARRMSSFSRVVGSALDAQQFLAPFTHHVVIVPPAVGYGLGVTSCPPSRTPYTHDVRIFYISSLSMLFDICEQCWYQRCVTSIEMGGDVLALGIRFI